MTSEAAICQSKDRNCSALKVAQIMAHSVLFTGFALKDMKIPPRFFYPNGPRVALLLGSP